MRMAFPYTTRIPESNKIDLGEAVRNEQKDRGSNFDLDKENRFFDTYEA